MPDILREPYFFTQNHATYWLNTWKLESKRLSPKIPPVAPRFKGVFFAFRMEGQEVLNVLVGGTFVTFSFLLGGRLSLFRSCWGDVCLFSWDN